MSWSRHVTIWCDGAECFQWTDYGGHNVPETRRLAAGEGWTRDGDEDLCRFHTKFGRDREGYYSGEMALDHEGNIIS